MTQFEMDFSKVNEKQAEGTKNDGWIVFNMDYCGNESCFESAWIDEETLLNNFILIK